REGRVRVAAPRARIVADGAHGTWSVPESEVFGHVRSYPSVTTFAVVWQDGRHALLAVRPVTGRRHQIRVHLAWVGHPVEGDPLFGPADAPRTLLHSWRLAFDAAWRDGSRVRAEAAPGPDFWAPVAGRLPGPGPLVLTTSTAAASRMGTASTGAAAAARASASRTAVVARARIRIGRIRLPSRSDQCPAPSREAAPPAAAAASSAPAAGARQPRA